MAAANLQCASLENSDDTLGAVCDVLKGFDDWLAECRAGFAERYANGKGHILTDWSWRGAVDFRIVCQGVSGLEAFRRSKTYVDERLPVRSRSSADRQALPIFSDEQKIGDAGPDRCMEMGYRYRNDALVFVEGVKLVEHPESGVPSLVWLQPMDEPLSFRTDGVYFSSSVLFKSFSATGDWEAVPDADLFAVRFHEFADGLVECGTKIVDGIASDCAQLDWQDFVNANADDILSGLRITLSDDLVGLCCHERLDGQLELLDVSFGPFYF